VNHPVLVEIRTNETTQALDTPAKQHTKVRNVIHQNRPAFDCLLVSKGGVCGKFNDKESQRKPQTE
jgi:hypothetical protein